LTDFLILIKNEKNSIDTRKNSIDTKLWRGCGELRIENWEWRVGTSAYFDLLRLTSTPLSTRRSVRDAQYGTLGERNLEFRMENLEWWIDTSTYFVLLRPTSTYFDSAQYETLRTRRSLRDAQYETLSTGRSVRDAWYENLGEGNYIRKRYGLTFGRIEHGFWIKFWNTDFSVLCWFMIFM
jgi:hypothetical protein